MNLLPATFHAHHRHLGAAGDAVPRARTRVTVTQSGEGTRVEVSARDGNFEPPERQVVLEVYPGEPPSKVAFDGQVVEAEWRDNAVRVSYQDDGQGHVLELP